MIDITMPVNASRIIHTLQEAGFEAAVRAVYPDCRVKFVNSALKNVVFSDDGVRLLRE